MFDRAVLALPGAKRALALLAASSLLAALLAVGQALALADALARLWGGSVVADVAGLLACFFACLVARRLIACGRDALMDRFASERAARMRLDLAGALYDGGPAKAAELGTGAAVSMLGRGIDHVETYIALIVPKVAAVMVEPIVLVVALLLVDWVSAVVCMAVIPFVGLYMVLLGRGAREAAERRHDEYVGLSNHFLDSLRGIADLRAFGRAADRADEVFCVSERFREATVATLRVATLSSLALDLFATFALAAASILLGFRLMGAWVGLAPALAALMLVPEFFAPILRFAGDFHATLDGKNALAAIGRVAGGAPAPGQGVPGDGERVPEAVPEAASDGAGLAKTPGPAAINDPAETTGPSAIHDPAETPGRAAPALAADRGSGSSDGDPTTPTPAGVRVVLRDVCFSYPEGADASALTLGSAPTPSGEAGGPVGAPGSPAAPGGPCAPALERLSFSAASPRRVGIVGASGAGKSTLASLLAGFARPTSGTAVFDEVGGEAAGSAGPCRAGVPLTDPRWLSRVTYVPQNPYVFRATLRQNVAFYRPDAPDDDVWRAIESAGLGDVARALPDGLDTVLGDGGRVLSGGQSQRIALARAFLDGARRRVLVFDEPTAHLDVETELALKPAMLSLMEGRLVFFATHRLHWMRDMDRILVLEAGRLVEQGAFDELVETGGPFARLVAQLRGGGRA